MKKSTQRQKKKSSTAKKVLIGFLAVRQLWQNTGGFNGISQFGSSILGSKRCIR